MGSDDPSLIWDQIHEFLGSEPPPGSTKRLAIGEMRFTMGMHRYYLERDPRPDGQWVARLAALADRHRLRLDERETANFVVFDRRNEYIGRVQDQRLILMPQKIHKDLFFQFIQLYLYHS